MKSLFKIRRHRWILFLVSVMHLQISIARGGYPVGRMGGVYLLEALQEFFLDAGRPQFCHALEPARRA